MNIIDELNSPHESDITSFVNGINNLFGYFFIAIGIYLMIVILILWVKYLLSKETKEVNINRLKWD